MYPFSDKNIAAKGVTETVKGLVGRGPKEEKDVFNASAWEEATGKVQEAYENQGYIYASIRPVVERRKVGKDSVPTVDLRWEIDERTPAIVNRIDIFGNDVTTETCIRDQIVMLPGDVFNRERLIQSYRSIANLGFFEQDMPPPDTRQANENGDIDLIFHVKEKRTGNVNFGASVGQGTGVGGFLGFDQPNLFGECKRGSLQWQFGQYIRDFSLSYTDPRIRQSNVSGTISLYNQRSRFIIRDIGQSNTSGGQLQFGFPLPNSRWTRLYLSYGGERVSYGGDGLVGDHQLQRLLPLDAGPHARPRYTARYAVPGGRRPRERRAAAQRRSAGRHGIIPATDDRDAIVLDAWRPSGKALGPEPLALVVGLSARAGALFGNPGPFFVSQSFSLGGVQYGNPLRGYEEFSITPRGYLPGRRSVPGPAELVRQCVLHQHGRARPAGEPAAIHGRVLRRGQSVGAAARFRSDAAVPRCRVRGVARHSAGSVGCRSRLRVRPYRCADQRSQGSKVAGPLQVRSDLLIGVQMRSTFRATTIALVFSVVASVAQAQAAATKIAYINSQALMEAAPGPCGGGVAARQDGPGFPRRRSTSCRIPRSTMLTNYQKDEPTLTAAAKDNAAEGHSGARGHDSRRSSTQFQQQFDAPAGTRSWRRSPTREEGARRHPRRRRLRDDPRQRARRVGHRLGGQESRHHRSRRVASHGDAGRQAQGAGNRAGDEAARRRLRQA